MASILGKALGDGLKAIDSARHEIADKRLWVAVQANSIPGALAALNAGANPSALSPKGRPLLQLSMQMQRNEMAQVLVKAGADVNIAFREVYADETPFSYLMQYGYGEKDGKLLDMLLDAGADVNFYRHKNSLRPTALFDLAFNDYPTEFIRRILDKGCDMQARNQVGQYADEVISWRYASGTRAARYYMLHTERLAPDDALDRMDDGLLERNAEGYAPLDHWRVWEKIPALLEGRDKEGTPLLPIEALLEPLPEPGMPTRLEAAMLLMPDMLTQIYRYDVWKDRPIEALHQFHKALPETVKEKVTNYRQLCVQMERKTYAAENIRGRE